MGDECWAEFWTSGGRVFGLVPGGKFGTSNGRHVGLVSQPLLLVAERRTGGRAGWRAGRRRTGSSMGGVG